jgi:hypothetical protein
MDYLNLNNTKKNLQIDQHDQQEYFKSYRINFDFYNVFCFYFYEFHYIQRRKNESV